MLTLSIAEQAMLDGREGPAAALALRVIADAGRMMGASELVTIESAHIDGCLYHGEAGVLFAERLVHDGGRVAVPSTLNVGALDLLHRDRERLSPETRMMAHRLAQAYVDLGCRQTWTCSPYQAGHRPTFGSHVAWGESNAVAFCNSVLGARTNRYGDFLDICAAISGRAPLMGLHRDAARRATILIDAMGLEPDFLAADIAYPILGAWLGREVGEAVAAFVGLGTPGEDRLKALGAAAASTGAVGLFHVVGSTPEAPTIAAATQGAPPERIIRLDHAMLQEAWRGLSTAEGRPGAPISGVAIGSPHLSAAELCLLDRLLGERRCTVPLYACTGRHSLREVGKALSERLATRGVEIVADTCVVVTPILRDTSGLIVTNSGKFAHYVPSNTGHEVIFAGLETCVDSAVAGRFLPGDQAWR
ncbi:aconitase X catalytic domain-containing protein [Sphingomonas sp. CGMCC 1.13654]|uniref:Aconitase X catalytic domain-containing protein n=1 Tax=Sphingomonas chungangi TaxID=2683589 RepID=A0A838L3A2_9SPHN|nr:aconitase X catalytic domain-containing protein [Sphingomonas chungangi]MBA2933547.1 aconitase X catalytic domain-containing protein [Sphingomonas chungangi]MVW54880.1 DUF521 domain-containing protein [Sphingomonas chungangi]